MMPVTASAPGKLVLFGDHAAVYGEPCLVTAVDLRFSVTIAPSDQPDISISTPDRRARHQSTCLSPNDLSAHIRPESAFVEAALIQFLRRCPVNTGFNIVTEGPRTTYGLGSSSAITAATMLAAAQFFECPLSQRDLFDLSYAAVLDVQQTGSGVDLAAAIHGGTVYYVNRGEVVESLPETTLPIIIGYSGAKVGTTSLIAQVASLRARQSAFIDPLLHMLGDITTAARNSIHQADWAAVGDLMNIHQGILDAFGVHTPQLARLIFAAREAGALGAKLSGAGGGDCMFALIAQESRAAVEFAIEQANGLPVRLPIGAEGVRIEPSAT